MGCRSAPAEEVNSDIFGNDATIDVDAGISGSIADVVPQIGGKREGMTDTMSCQPLLLNTKKSLYYQILAQKFS